MTADKRVTQATFQPSSFIMHGDNVKLRSLGGTPSIVVTCQLTVDRQRGIRSWWSIIFPRQPSWVERGSGLSRKKNPYYFFIFPRRNKNVERKSAVNNSELFRIFEFFFFEWNSFYSKNSRIWKLKNCINIFEYSSIFISSS